MSLHTIKVSLIPLLKYFLHPNLDNNGLPTTLRAFTVYSLSTMPLLVPPAPLPLDCQNVLTGLPPPVFEGGAGTGVVILVLPPVGPFKLDDVVPYRFLPTFVRLAHSHVFNCKRHVNLHLATYKIAHQIVLSSGF